jgi:dihydroorotate dehydrogenase
MNHLLSIYLVVYATICQRYNFFSKQKTASHNLFLPTMYKLLRSFLFFFDPEKVHYFSMNWLGKLCRINAVKSYVRNSFTPKGQKAFTIFNLQFTNRVGLGAGFDKNAQYLTELDLLGFGFVETGTVTPKAQAGNDKPRLFRLPKDKALINRMGFNNDGVVAVAQRIQAFRNNNPQSKLIIGGNIGKNKITPNAEAWKDYEFCFKELHTHVDYFVVNVSSPNTPGLRELQEKESLRKILINLQQLNAATQNPKPILLKIAPDLEKAEINDVVDLALEIKLDGLVASNTTIYRRLPNTSPRILESLGPGGLSGQPLKNKSTEVIKYIAGKTNGQIPIIASGGIFTGQDAQEKLNAGASLVQVWTGFIYEGPAIIKNICNVIQ